MRNFDAKPNGAIRYELADLAFRFQSYFVARHRSRLDQLDPQTVYDAAVAPQLDTYIRKAFERVAAEAITRLGGRADVPVLAELGRWEGADRERNSVEIDLVGRTFEGHLVTGEVKWNRRAAGPSLHEGHVAKLGALAASGRAWAREALQPTARRIYVSAAGFTGGWGENPAVTRLELGDLYVA